MPPPLPCRASRRALEHAARLLDTACARAGLSNVTLAKRLHVGRDAVSKQRKGQKWLEVEPLIQLALLLDLAPASLLPENPTSLDSQLMQGIAGLTPEAKAKLLPIVDMLRALPRALP